MYCSLSDLKILLPEKRILELVDDEQDGAGSFVVTPPNALYLRVTGAINEADSTINSYLSGRYAVPFTTVPEEIKWISANLALCTLYARKAENKAPEGMVERKKNQIEWLKSVQAGDAEITGFERNDPSVVSINKTDADRIFSSDLLDTY